MTAHHEDVHDSQAKLPLDYFVLAFGLAIPFWLLGGNKLPLPVNLPAGALVTVVPVTAAAALVYRRSGRKGVTALLKQAVDYRKIRNKVSYLPVMLLAPLLYFLSYIIMRLTGLPLPDRPELPLQTAPAFFVLYFISDAGEELGWTSYALEPMQNRWGVLKASLILGAVWAIWHAVPFLQTGNSASWVVWQSLKTIAMRVIIAWVYNNTNKSTFATILYHTTDNVSWSLFPNYSSHYNPMVTGLLNWIVVAIVAFGWRAGTRARLRANGPQN